MTRILQLVVLVAFAAMSLGSHNLLAGELELQDLLGEWKCVAGDWGGKPDPLEETVVWKFSQTGIEMIEDDHVTRAIFSLNLNATPAQIDISYRDRDFQYVWKGIVRSEGGCIQICATLGVKGELVERPKAFEVKGDDTKMILLSRNEPDGD